MKRYEPELDLTATEFQGMEEKENGEWVKYDDALRERKILLEQIEKLKELVSDIYCDQVGASEVSNTLSEVDEKLKEEGIL